MRKTLKNYTVSGPFYWLIVLVVAAIILVGSGAARVIRWRQPA